MRGRAVSHIDRPGTDCIECSIDHRGSIRRIDSKYAIVSRARTQVTTTADSVGNDTSRASNIVHIRFPREQESPSVDC